MRKKESPPETRHSKETRAIWPLLAGLVLSLLLVAVSCGGTAGEQRADGSAEGEPAEDESQTGTEKSQSGTAEEQAEADLENPSLGSESASVVMTEYADYQ